MSPAITKRFVRSSVSAPAGVGVRSAGPTAAMRLPSTTIVASRSGAGATPSKRAPQRIARMLTGPDLRATSIRGRASRAAPDVARSLADQRELCLLVRRRQQVALLRRGKSTLWAQREPLQRHELRGFANPPLERAPVLQCGVLGRDQPQHHRSIVGHVPQWLEAPGARVVVLQQEAGEAARAEHLGRDGVVAAAADVLALVVAPAKMQRERDARAVPDHRVVHLDAEVDEALR